MLGVGASQIFATVDQAQGEGNGKKSQPSRMMKTPSKRKSAQPSNQPDPPCATDRPIPGPSGLHMNVPSPKIDEDKMIFTECARHFSCLQPIL